MIVERIHNTTQSYSEIPVEKLVRERKKTLTTFAVDPDSQSQNEHRQENGAAAEDEQEAAKLAVQPDQGETTNKDKAQTTAASTIDIVV